MNKDSGFTKFPNELLEKLLCERLTANEYKIILAVIRFTYGYHLECNEFSIAKICEFTKKERSGIAKAVNRLIGRGIIREIAKANFETSRVLAVEKDINLWRSDKETVVVKDTPTVVAKDTPTVVGNSTHTSYIKENIKEIYKYKKNELKNEKKPSFDLELFEQMINTKD